MTVKKMIKRAPVNAVAIFYDGNGFAWYYTKGTHRLSESANKIGIPYKVYGDNIGQYLAYKQDNGKWFIHKNRYSEASKKLIELGYKWNDSTGWAIDNKNTSAIL